MPRLFTKIILSFFASLMVLFSFGNFFEAKAAPDDPPPPKPAAAAPAEGSWYNQDFGQWYGKVYDDKNPSEIFGERYTAAQVQWVVYSLISFLINLPGSDNAKIFNCFIQNTVDPKSCLPSTTGMLPVNQNLTNVSNQSLFSLVFADRPLSGISYFKQKIQNFSLVPVAHAQNVGFGFTALQPIQSIWRAFRDVSFGLFVIMAVVFAFMIMFRVKLSPQVVISVQSALPKIIISLILVTFSYAIAGLLIDFMYVIIGFISIIFSRIQIFGFPASNIFNFMTLGQPVGWNTQFGVFGLFILYVAGFFYSFLILLIFNIVTNLTNLVAPFALMANGLKSLMVTLGLLMTVIVLIIAIWNGIKTIWALLKAFVNIILLTIFAPLQLTLGALIPGFGFGTWVKNYISNLSVFVVTGFLFLFSFIFLGYGIKLGFEGLGADVFGGVLSGYFLGNNSSLPFVGSMGSWPPLLGTGGASWTGLLFLGVSFVLFTMIPKATEIVQALLAGKPFNYGTAIGEAIWPVKTGVGFGIGSTATYYKELGEQQVRTPITEREGKKNLKKGANLNEIRRFF